MDKDEFIEKLWNCDMMSLTHAELKVAVNAIYSLGYSICQVSEVNWRTDFLQKLEKVGSVLAQVRKDNPNLKNVVRVI